MTEEEYFRKNYPDSCWGDRPLSPYWDFFQDGVEFGERKSEERITELEQKLADAKKVLVVEHFEAYGQCRDSKRIADLEAQIEKMKSDVLSLIKDRMNDDIDQNIIERLAEKWEIKEK